jgi:hypothetical protein
MSIVFAAGFLVPQQPGHLDYFRGAAAAFPGALFPPVPPLGDVSVRANDLANQINAAFPAGPILTSTSISAARRRTKRQTTVWSAWNQPPGSHSPNRPGPRPTISAKSATT